MIWDYDIEELKKKDIKLYLEKCILYWLPKWKKFDAKILYKYLPELNIPHKRREYYEFLLDEMIKDWLLKV